MSTVAAASPPHRLRDKHLHRAERVWLALAAACVFVLALAQIAIEGHI